MPTSTLKDAMSCIERGCWCGDISQIVGETCHDHAYRAFQGSLDAAKALHEALLPGWHWSVSGDYAAVMDHDGSDDFLGLKHFPASSPQPARAWLLAILRALAAEGGE